MKRQPNPNTAYGRRRIMQENYYLQEKYRNDHPEEAKNEDAIKTFFGILIVIIFIILFIYVKLQPDNGHYIGSRGGHYHYTKGGNKKYD